MPLTWGPPESYKKINYVINTGKENYGTHF